MIVTLSDLSIPKATLFPAASETGIDCFAVFSYAAVANIRDLWRQIGWKGSIEELLAIRDSGRREAVPS